MQKHQKEIQTFTNTTPTTITAITTQL